MHDMIGIQCWMQSSFLLNVFVSRCSYWTPYYDVLDEHGEAVLRIKGPCCICDMSPCCGEVEFKVGFEIEL